MTKVSEVLTASNIKAIIEALMMEEVSSSEASVSLSAILQGAAP
jgi:hypothetical protein